MLKNVCYRFWSQKMTFLKHILLQHIITWVLHTLFGEDIMKLLSIIIWLKLKFTKDNNHHKLWQIYIIISQEFILTRDHFPRQLNTSKKVPEFI